MKCRASILNKKNDTTLLPHITDIVSYLKKIIIYYILTTDLIKNKRSSIMNKKLKEDRNCNLSNFQLGSYISAL